MYSNKVLLLDCGCVCDVSNIVAYIDQQLGLPKTAIRLGVPSHAHPDHLGGARKLQEQHGFMIAAHPYINDWYQGLAGSIQQWIDIQLALFVARAHDTPKQNLSYQKTINADETLQDGQPLPHFEEWRVFFTPGHTHHDVVLFNQQAGFLYAADSIVKVGRRYILPIPMILRQHMATSLEKIRHLKVTKLGLAHNQIHDVSTFIDIIDTLKSQLDPEPKYRIREKAATAIQHFSPALRHTKRYGLPSEAEGRDLL